MKDGDILIFVAILITLALFVSHKLRHQDKEIKQTTPYSILEVESEFGITLFVPTVWELQEHAVRHGANITIDNIWGSETRDKIEEVRIRQEAAIHNAIYED